MMGENLFDVGRETPGPNVSLVLNEFFRAVNPQDGKAAGRAARF
jgi:hypothetical protein